MRGEGWCEGDWGGAESSVGWSGRAALARSDQADLNDGRTISVISQAKATASARDSEANKSLVWLGDKNKACVAQMENK